MTDKRGRRTRRYEGSPMLFGLLSAFCVVVGIGILLLQGPLQQYVVGLTLVVLGIVFHVFRALEGKDRGGFWHLVVLTAVGAVRRGTARRKELERAREGLEGSAPPGESERGDGFPVVFLIHGHDDTNTLRLQVHLEGWKVSVVRLSAEAGAGRTIIEKFEGEAVRSAFAIALLTPDDMVEGDGLRYGQARPNVFFELGWFCGQFGRRRTCVVAKTGTRIPSDLAGIGRIMFDASIEEKTARIDKELEAAGMERRHRTSVSARRE